MYPKLIKSNPRAFSYHNYIVIVHISLLQNHLLHIMQEETFIRVFHFRFEIR